MSKKKERDALLDRLMIMLPLLSTERLRQVYLYIIHSGK